MISTPCIEIHTTTEERPSVPAWFAEVVIIARHLAKKGLLETLAQQIRLVHGRIGNCEPLDFLVVLIGYAISGERTLTDFLNGLLLLLLPSWPCLDAPGFPIGRA